MDKPNTQTIELIANDIKLVFLTHALKNMGGSTYESHIAVTGYRMSDSGIYFVYDKSFVVNGSLVNEYGEKKLFFVPYAHIVSMETALAEDVSTVEKEQSMIDTTESDQVAG
jgi:hypothetical protein